MEINQIDYSKYETLFLDRDGVINELRPDDYVKCWEEFVFCPGILNWIAKWSKHFKHIFIVTNQRGVGKGVMSEVALEDVHNRMLQAIREQGGKIDQIYICTAVSDEDPFRKPNIGMALQAQKEYPDVDFSTSLMIGDKPSDRLFAERSGMDFKWIC